jgi:predicted dehydrogenase
MSEPLRIGVLGAARINELALLEPARITGARLVAVAARDRSRAEIYAQQNGFDRALDSYDAVINDPQVEAIYNPLPNSLHALWNLAALRAGKHVLAEKPFASNAAEAQRVADAARGTGLVVFEAFHYAYHPSFRRFVDIISDGTIGELQHLHVAMVFPCEDLDDVRWSWPLSGGALMDLGCYCLHAIRTVATRQGGEPTLISIDTGRRGGAHPDIDAWANVEFTLPGGARATAEANLNAPRNNSMTATGSRGRVHLADFISPQADDRLIISRDDGETVERQSRRTTYTYQLEAFAGAVREGRPFPTTTADALANMSLIDDCYRAAGMPLRQSGS